MDGGQNGQPHRHGHIYLEVVTTRRPHVGIGRETKAVFRRLTQKMMAAGVVMDALR